MLKQERRKISKEAMAALKRQLNDAQLTTLSEMERFGWELRFVRRPPFQASIPVVFDGDGRRFAVIEADGSLNHTPDIVIRP